MEFSVSYGGIYYICIWTQVQYTSKHRECGVRFHIAFNLSSVVIDEPLTLINKTISFSAASYV